MIPDETTVLVIGGGPNGLVASALLAKHGIDNVVLERRAGTQRAPAAHVIRHRPLEVLSQMGAREAIRQAIPPLSMENITWCATLAGTEIGRLDLCAGQGPSADPLDQTWINLSQNLLEPILVETVSHAPESTIVFGAECSEIEQDEGGVSALIQRADGTQHRIDAHWAIAADGAGSRTRKRIDIPMEGSEAAPEFMMVHFKADLTPWLADRPGPIFWILNPESAGTLIVHDPKRSFVFMTMAVGIEDEAATIPSRLSRALGTPPDLDLEIISVDSWRAFNQVASRYRSGRILLAGDAAHRFPPTGGLGLNTGLLEVHNLVWKLALVEQGHAREALLDSYQAECRPAALRNADDSMKNMIGLGQVHARIGGFTDLAGLEDRLESMTAEERGALQNAIDAQLSHFASDGHYPEPERAEGDLPVMFWPAPYEGFTLFAEDESTGRRIAREVSARSKFEIGFQTLQPGAGQSLALPCDTFLTRPDGLIEWVGRPEDADPVDDLCRILTTILGT